jgi:hypothetical protein
LPAYCNAQKQNHTHIKNADAINTCSGRVTALLVLKSGKIIKIIKVFFYLLLYLLTVPELWNSKNKYKKSVISEAAVI